MFKKGDIIHTTIHRGAIDESQLARGLFSQEVVQRVGLREVRVFIWDRFA